MEIDITIKIGGEAGQGILTVGHMLAKVCHHAGLYIMANNEFESRIRGGHNTFQIRISNRPVNAPRKAVHLIIALDHSSYVRHKDELMSDGVLIMEERIYTGEKDALPIPFESLAKEVGGKIFSNTVAAGACLGLLGAPFHLVENHLHQRFQPKGDKVIQKNIKAARKGYAAVSKISFPFAFDWAPQKPAGVILEGSKALALGALAGDCRFGAFYPMSPATGIMSHLTAFSDRFPLVIEQAEDEIAAINMVIGASFAGARAMTATSGGGFCLMTEGLGLAAMTETPVVIINAQRPGPATGLPTRTAQADLLFVIFASQDEFPRFVFAPGTIAEAYMTTARAFHLSQKYQVPAIVLVDKYFTDSLFTEPRPLPVPKDIEQFIVDAPQDYQRYQLTDSGISPRALPCNGDAQVMITGNEHSEDGHISESKTNRKAMVEKRQAKTIHMIEEMNGPEVIHKEATFLLTGWGGSRWAVVEATEMLQAEGYPVGALIFTDLWPFPVDAVLNSVREDQKLIMVEQNSTAQLGQLIKAQTGLHATANVLGYDGRPFYPEDIVKSTKQYLR
jgi:2-oxoglutarate ferredoxin oxidoreductase subunit alpha